MMQNKESSKNIIWAKILPQHKAPVMLWEEIEENLDSRITPDVLPTHNANPALWKNIETALESQKRKKTVIFRIRFLIPMSAAVLAALFLVSNPIIKRANQKNILYNAETVLSNEFTHYCTNYPQVCNTSEFKDLTIRLNELNYEKKELEKIS